MHMQKEKGSTTHVKMNETPAEEKPVQEKSSHRFMKLITGRLVNLVTTEINKHDTQVLVRQKIILPIITLIYSELYPYIIVFVTTLSIILILSILTFVFFICTYLKK